MKLIDLNNIYYLYNQLNWQYNYNAFDLGKCDTCRVYKTNNTIIFPNEYNSPSRLCLYCYKYLLIFLNDFIKTELSYINN